MVEYMADISNTYVVHNGTFIDHFVDMRLCEDIRGLI